ncbi:head scaffolding protein [Clostridium phage phiCTP1]|uniref:head scaffolding protein n=1 Tax=Clostridium phage phiCTP1 TaxID=871584 RepID=UPI0001E07818|nr:head scaffolding protein [Clostridium phage phiCTP1]ADL40311.1 putative scaffold protein [Clostridium phage phiCTP1]WMU07942.1 putative capsid assembly scaffolding protein [Clostridium phage vB_CtyS-FA88]
MPKLTELIGAEAYAALPQNIKDLYKDTDFVNKAEYVPKEDYSNVVKDRDNYKVEVTKRDKQLTQLGTLTKDNEELKGKIDTMKTENAKALDAKEKEFKGTLLNNAIDSALKGSGAKNAKVVRGMLDMDKLVLDPESGKVIGLNDQIEGLKKSDDYLFTAKPTGTGSFNAGGTEGNHLTGDDAGDGSKPKLQIGELLAKNKSDLTGGKTVEDALSKFIKR